MEEIRGSVNVVESAVARLFYSEDGEDGDTLLGGCSKTAHLSIIMLMRLSIILTFHLHASGDSQSEHPVHHPHLDNL